MSETTQAPEPTSYVVEGDTYRKLIAERDAYKRIANDLVRQLREITPADTNAPPEKAASPRLHSQAECVEIAAVLKKQRAGEKADAPFGTCGKCEQPITSFHNINGCPAETEESRPLAPHVAEAETNWREFKKAAQEIRAREAASARPETVAPLACGYDVGFNFRCRRARGHDGLHTWDPKRLLGEDPVSEEVSP